jgi:hypothetical protein
MQRVVVDVGIYRGDNSYSAGPRGDGLIPGSDITVTVTSVTGGEIESTFEIHAIKILIGNNEELQPTEGVMTEVPEFP